MRVNQSSNSNVQGTETSRTRATSRSKNTEDTGDTEKSSSSSKESGDVKTSISSKAKEFSKAKAAASESPDVRAEKVAALKARIAAGKYNVDADAVAEKMVDEHMQTRSIG